MKPTLFFYFCWAMTWQILSFAQTPSDSRITIDTLAEPMPIEASDDSDVYTANMQRGISIMDKAMTPGELQQAATFFEQMTEEQPMDWLPPYYAAYCYVTMAFIEDNTVMRDNYLDQAQIYLDVAGKIEPRNAEIVLVQAFAYQVRTAIDPAVRMPEFGTLAVLSLQDAEQLAPDNPRIYYLKAQNLFLAPEIDGGGLGAACPTVRIAARKYASEMNNGQSLLPKWGAAMTEYMRQICEQLGR